MRLETLRWNEMSLTGNDVVMLPTNVSCQVPLLSLSDPRHAMMNCQHTTDVTDCHLYHM